MTKSALRTSMTAPRVMRAICGQPKTARISTSVQTVRLVRNIGSCIRTIAPRISGRAKKMSLMRARTAVDPAAVVPGQGAHDAADQEHAEGGEEAHRHRGPRAEDDAGVDVAALLGEAQRVAGGGSGVGVGQLARLRGRVDREKSPGKSGHRHDHQDQERGDEEERLLAQVPPGLTPKAQRRGFVLDPVRRQERGLGDVGHEVLDPAAWTEGNGSAQVAVVFSGVITDPWVKPGVKQVNKQVGQAVDQHQDGDDRDHGGAFPCRRPGRAGCRHRGR